MLKLICLIESGFTGMKVPNFAFDSKLERIWTVYWNLDISLTICTLSELMILKSLIVLCHDINSCDADDLLLSILSDKVQQYTTLNDFLKNGTFGLGYC